MGFDSRFPAVILVGAAIFFVPAFLEGYNESSDRKNRDWRDYSEQLAGTCRIVGDGSAHSFNYSCGRLILTLVLALVYLCLKSAIHVRRAKYAIGKSSHLRPVAHSRHATARP